MSKNLILYALMSVCLSSCVAPVPQEATQNQAIPREVQPQIDPVLAQIVELAHQKESGNLTDYQESQLTDWISFHGKQIIMSGKVFNVESDGELVVVGLVKPLSAAQFDRVFTYVSFTPLNPTSTIAVSKGQPITVRGTITNIKHRVVGSGGDAGWVLRIEVKE